MRMPILFALAGAFAAGSSLPLYGGLEWERTEFTAPAVFGQASLEATYPFKNTGTEPVRILKVKTSCGCTYAAASQEVIAPGESAEVAAFFETESREGPQSSTITVLTDEPDESATTLRFRSDIPAAAELPTRVVRWKAADPREARTFAITVQPGVSLQLLPPKRPLPVEVKLEKNQATDGKPGYTLTLAPLDGDSGAGILPLEAHWAGEGKRLYNLYVRVDK